MTVKHKQVSSCLLLRRNNSAHWGLAVHSMEHDPCHSWKKCSKS